MNIDEKRENYVSYHLVFPKSSMSSLLRSPNKRKKLNIWSGVRNDKIQLNKQDDHDVYVQQVVGKTDNNSL